MDQLLLSHIKELTFVLQALSGHNIDFVYQRKASKSSFAVEDKKGCIREQMDQKYIFQKGSTFNIQKVSTLKIKKGFTLENSKWFHTQKTINKKVSFNLFHATILFQPLKSNFRVVEKDYWY